MKILTRSLAALTAMGLAGGQVHAQGGSFVVRDAPVHAVPADRSERDQHGPVEDNSPPDTLNAQYAAQSRPAPAPVRKAAPVEGPSAAIAARIIDSAGAFEAYMRKAGAIGDKFADRDAVAKAVSTSSAYEIQQFQEGETAYAALAALQNPAFVQGVYDLGRDPRERAALADRLLADPGVVLEVDGADEAAAMVSGVLAQMGADLVKSGQAVRQAAYDVQRQAWSKEDVPHAEQRLAETKAHGAVKASLGAADTDALIQTIVSLRKTAAESPGRTVAPTPVVERGLAVAALAVLGRAGEDRIDMIAPLLGDAKSADCMKMAKLNLYQCMAAAGPEYEDVFCVGAHAMIDTGQCVIQASGQSPIPTSLQRTSAPAPAGARSVSVPIALMSTVGPERQRAYGRADAERAPAPAARDYALEQDARDVPPAYAPDPRRTARPAPREDLYDDRAARAGDLYQPPGRQAFNDEAAGDAGAYADPYGRPPAPYFYGR
ncbi:MAG TPA: hypothetical protein VL358_07395 [Caulobacteraceae bacterium]|jgi:hypothetical protein|nr:hypothetical protein [Caulobacteraceae bacterium]